MRLNDDRRGDAEVEITSLTNEVERRRGGDTMEMDGGGAILGKTIWLGPVA